MVRLKIAYWEFDFEAVCPTLDHDLLSQAHIHHNINISATGSTHLKSGQTLKEKLTGGVNSIPFWQEGLSCKL